MRYPFCCPVCGGTGFVPKGFYDSYPRSTTDIAQETCRSCNKGIVWSDEVTSEEDDLLIGFCINPDNTDIT